MLGKLRIPQRTTTLSIRRTRQDEYTGPLVDETFPSKGNPDELICCPVHTRRHHSHDEKEVTDGNVLSKKTGSVAACLRDRRTNDSPKQGYSRTNCEGLKTVQTLKLYFCQPKYL